MRLKHTGKIAALATAVLALGAATAQGADFGVVDFDGEITANAAGDPYTQAGGHPFAASTTIVFDSEPNPDAFGAPFPVEDVKDIHVDLPAGLVGNPQGLPKCTQKAFAGEGSGPVCHPDTIVGIATTTFLGSDFYWPVYNLESPPDVPATFGFLALVQPVIVTASVRSAGDYGLSVDIADISQGLGLTATGLTLWGVPADPGHDVQRCNGLGFTPVCPAPTPSTAPRVPFLTLPTACTAPGVGLETRMTANSWPDPGTYDSAGFVSHLPPAYPAPAGDRGPAQGPTGCGRLPFDASVSTRVDSRAAGSPTGLQVDLTVPQDGLGNPDGLAPAHLRKAVVTLPEGMAVNAAAADGLAGCSSAQIKLSSTADPACPAGSRLGTVEIDTPLLEDPMDGAIHLASQGDNPHGNLLSLYLVAKGPGLVFKLPGRIDPDPVTGRLRVTFDDNPQLPFSSMSLRFKSGARAPLVNPVACGTHAAGYELTAWSGKVVTGSDPVVIDQGCGPRGFAPGFEAGATNPAAGGSGAFVLRVTRTDRDQELRTIATALPEGLMATLKGVPRCAEAAAAAGTCGEESRIGRADVGTGAGPNPFFLGGKVFLTGGYKGAPFGLLIQVPALAGPLDLGVVNVRAALRVDPRTAAVSVEADPMPRILQGIPVLARDVRITIDRAGFMRNPTSCKAKAVTGAIGSYEGAAATGSSPFRVGDCAALGLSPRLALRLKGARREGGHPQVRAVLKQPAGQSNLRRLAVKLPLSLALDPDNAQSDALCEYDDGQRGQCPAASIVGRAKAVSPVLDRPLTGPVHFVKGVRFNKRGGRIRTTPTLLVKLHGEVDLDLRARSDVRRGRLVTTFESIPDAPVSRFELTLNGGPKGILVVTRARGLCGARNAARVDVDGQNGKRHDRTHTLRTPCKKR